MFVTVTGTKWLCSHPPRCACGQLTTQHVAIPPGANSVEEAIQLVQIDTPKDKWSLIKHTRTYPTDAFGVIEFQGGGFINKAMVRLFPSASSGRNSMKRVVFFFFYIRGRSVMTPFPCSPSISVCPMTPNRITCCIWWWRTGSWSCPPCSSLCTEACRTLTCSRSSSKCSARDWSKLPSPQERGSSRAESTPVGGAGFRIILLILT